MSNDNRKTLILEALHKWVAQRPGFEPGNYDRAGYRSDSRRVTQQRHDFDRMALSVATLQEITADDLIAAFAAFSGRLSLMRRDSAGEKVIVHARDTFDAVELDYCTGQYWCTEYRAAACAVLALALWACQRKSLPAPEYRQHGSAAKPPMRTEVVYGPRKLSAGEWLRASFRNWYGRGIQSRWFS